MAEPLGRRVLIVDDEILVALALRALLEDGGFEVVGIAADGREAVALCQELRPDLVLMDVRMPGIDGLEATRLIMAQCPTKIVIHSAIASPATVAAACEAGAIASLSKPASAEQLLAALRAPAVCRTTGAPVP